MDQRRILVIGGGGFLGRILCDLLRDAGHEVIPLNRRPNPDWTEIQYCAENLDSLDDSFDLVFLLAAHIPYGEMNCYSPRLIETNLGLPLRVAQRFRNARLVYASSVSVYGTPLWLPMTEEHPFNRPCAYALTKLAGEIAVAAHPNQVSLRFSSLYGAGMKARTFLPLIVEQARRTGRITLFGDGARTQDFLHIRDAARMLAVAGTHTATGIFNAANGRAISNLEAAQTVAALLPGVEIVFSGEDCTPAAAFAMGRWHESFPAIDTIDLATGLAEMIADEA